MDKEIWFEAKFLGNTGTAIILRFGMIRSCFGWETDPLRGLHCWCRAPCSLCGSGYMGFTRATQSELSVRGRLLVSASSDSAHQLSPLSLSRCSAVCSVAHTPRCPRLTASRALLLQTRSNHLCSQCCSWASDSRSAPLMASTPEGRSLWITVTQKNTSSTASSCFTLWPLQPNVMLLFAVLSENLQLIRFSLEHCVGRRAIWISNMSTEKNVWSRGGQNVTKQQAEQQQ